MSIDQLVKNNPNLKEIEIADKLRFLDLRCLKKLKNLEFLRLYVENIGYLSDDTFNGLNNLKYLDLYWKRINQLPTNVFQNSLKNLVELSLSSNFLFRNFIFYLVF